MCTTKYGGEFHRKPSEENVTNTVFLRGIQSYYHIVLMV